MTFSIEPLESRLHLDSDIEIALEDGAEVFTSDPLTGTLPAPQIDFGQIVKNQQATARAFLIRNLGQTPLNVGDLTLPAGFFVIEFPPAQVAPGDAGRVVIGIETAATGNPFGAVVIASDDPDEPLIQFAITGTIVEPSPVTVVAVDGEIGAPIIAGSDAPRSLVRITFRNDSEAVLSQRILAQVYASEDGVLDTSDAVAAARQQRVRILAGDERTVTLRFTPKNLPPGESELIGSVTVEGAATVSRVGPHLSAAAPFVRLTGDEAGRSAVSIARGKRTVVVVRLTNEGNVPTRPAGTTVNLRISADGTDAGVLFGTNVATRLRVPPGQSRSVRIPVTFPADALEAGDYQLLVAVSSEKNETNDEILAVLPVRFL